MTPPSHIYIHIPFCKAKCAYCNFYSIPYENPLAEEYISAISKEMQVKLKEGGRPKTIYIGGGTPSVLNENQLARLLQVINELLDFSDLEEFTIEINPGTLSNDKIAFLSESGINRISLGIQSLLDSKLKTLGRIHNSSAAKNSIERLRDANFNNIGMDLIYGVPGDTLSEWQKDLEKTTELNPEHISTYCLSVEPGTKLENSINTGEFEMVPENIQKEMYYAAINYLCSHGYEHYEISNFAKHGKRSRHNVATWNYKPYIGLGPSAASFDGVSRFRNISDINKYIEKPGELYESEKLSVKQTASEVMMLGLRKMEGITAEEFNERTGQDIKENYGRILKPLQDKHLIEIDSDTTAYKLSKEALFISDEVLLEFF